MVQEVTERLSSPASDCVQLSSPPHSAIGLPLLGEMSSCISQAIMGRWVVGFLRLENHMRHSAQEDPRDDPSSRH